MSGLSKPPTFLRNSVYYLLFPPGADIIKAIEIISGSARLISLLIDGPLRPNLLLLLDELRPQRLHLSLLPSNDWPESPWTRSILNSPLLSEHTRLEDNWSPLAALPALTHLCLSEELAEDILRAALAECLRPLVAISGFWVSASPGYIQVLSRVSLLPIHP
ncbi:hypothetical protein B0H14DRAFT_3466121 [Mycena olivaceomarginata]|nr:hypothetical protein B0H14DRAFT_3466121 [Mycena olivaceomarginata]